MNDLFWQGTIATLVGLVITALTRVLNKYLPDPTPVVVPIPNPAPGTVPPPAA